VRALALVAVLGVACAPSYPPVVYRATEAPPALEPLAPPVVYGPVAHAAATWNEPAEPTTSHESDAVFSALYELAREKGDPERDGRLDTVAAELGEVAARGAPLDAALVEFALRQHGVADSAALVLAAKATEPDAIVAELTPQLGDSLFYGNVHVGLGGMSPMVLVVTHTSLVTLAPSTPRFVEANGEATILATLDPRFHAPHVTIAHDDGSVEHPELAALDPWTFVTSFRCGAHAGAQWVLVEGCDEKNTDMRLLLVPIDCATHSPDAYRVEPRANTAAADDLERRLASLVNRERTAAGLAPLGGDRRAAAAASTEVRLMRAAGSVEHALGGTTAASRLRDAGLIPPVVHEATLHAPDLATASELLMNDSAYRAAVMSPDVTHIGVAAARDAHGELYIALELVAIVPPIDVARLRANVLARLRAHRLLPENPVLDELARRYARGRVQGWSEADMISYMEHDSELVFSSFEHLHRAMTLLLHNTVDEVDLGPPSSFDAVGISVLQAPRNGALAGRVWVVILLGELRPKR